VADEIERELPPESRISGAELTGIGLLVRELVRDPRALAWWREEVEQWAAEHTRRIEQRDRFERRRAEYVKRALRRPALQDKNRRPRKRLCAFEAATSLPDWRGKGEKWPGVPGIWVPFLLHWPAPRALFPLPLPGRASLALPEKCAALAAVHDCTVRGGTQINHWGLVELLLRHKRATEAAAYRQLVKRVQNVPASDGPHLRAIVEEVRGALADANPAAAGATATDDLVAGLVGGLLTANSVSADSGSRPGPEDDHGYLAPSRLATKFDLPPDPLRTRLNRWRRRSATGWIENPDRAARQPKYLYMVSAVYIPVIKPMLDQRRDQQTTSTKKIAR
jgi:hypothetical protein